jgi:hypothetical protein
MDDKMFEEEPFDEKTSFRQSIVKDILMQQGLTKALYKIKSQLPYPMMNKKELELKTVLQFI